MRHVSMLALIAMLAGIAGCCVTPASRPDRGLCLAPPAARTATPATVFCPQVTRDTRTDYSTDCQRFDEVQHEIIGTDGSRRLIPDTVFRSWMWELKPAPTDPPDPMP